MKIIPARPEDSHLIGESVVEAIGIEIAQNLAGENHTLEDVVNMFAMLAKRDDTQYSYTNTLVALDDRGNPVGVCVGYDGARLHELRLPFFEAVSSCLGLSLEGVEDECDAEEFYLDTLAVLPEYRGKGIASELLKESIKRAAKCGKPAGLLVDPVNPKARRLYERVGFIKVGDRPFVHVMMDHMQYLG
ncbi:GNAT family N-acetyltransferase [uncultured Duncaniella sp.]|uniref:GNAT family N-acetyltransferase n=1 Tax=uncultured Duncaniella sp. TaxID=2768039 RepID=UPI0025B0EDEC|nr:GNAT family N-acetyltransferase [uncultured Duncaniella sp.]